MKLSKFRGLCAATALIVLLVLPAANAQLDPNDPWPKYGHDVRNTCKAPNNVFGPHAPELRWWAPVGTQGAEHPGGAAIATVGGVNYAFVGMPTNAPGLTNAQIKIFRIDDPSYNRSTAATPSRTVDLAATDGVVRATPLIFGTAPNRRYSCRRPRN
jgi:hypothetical protein